MGPKKRTKSRNGVREKKNRENFPVPLDKFLGMEENHQKVGHQGVSY